MEGLTEGRIVHYVLSDYDWSQTMKSAPHAGEHRPAIVVKVWGANGTANLQVFTDSNYAQDTNDHRPQVMWKTSVVFDEVEKKPGTWHWIEKA